LRTRTKDSAYECGMVPQGEAQPRFSVKFYLVAMLFILFDLEIVFMYPWAVVFREAITHSQVIFWSMLSFVSILMVGYVYALKKGALDWKK
jgi:NADH-quinone oxidoreductase subunit A